MEMVERQQKFYVNCLVCGRFLMKLQGECSLEIPCDKCRTDLVIRMKDNLIYVHEDRRTGNKNGQAKVIVAKGRLKDKAK